MPLVIDTLVGSLKPINIVFAVDVAVVVDVDGVVVLVVVAVVGGGGCGADVVIAGVVAKCLLLSWLTLSFC